MNRTSLVAFGYNDYLNELPIARPHQNLLESFGLSCYNDYLEELPIASTASSSESYKNSMEGLPIARQDIRSRLLSGLQKLERTNCKC